MNESGLLGELHIKAVRSGGPGGQHVNKVASKVQLSFDIANSQALTEEEKALLLSNLKNKLVSGTSLQLSCDSERSQHRNREQVIKNFLALIRKGLKPARKRRLTKPSKKADRKRLDEKKKLSDKKQSRKKPDL